jgi:carbon monoxide dehydrogenase subunit G
MTTQVERTIEVDVPVHTAYNQWTQFEEFPQFMGGVDRVEQIGDSLTHWVAQIAGVRREWDAAILEQVPDSKVAWAATTGATNAGAVYFQSLGPDRTLVRLNLEYEPEGLVEKVGDFLNVVQRQAEADLERFKRFIEGRGTATGGWRGTVDEAGTVGSPGVDTASPSRGDSGKAGVSGTAIAAGVVAAGAAAVGAAAAAKRAGGQESESGRESEVTGDVVAVGPTGGTESTLQTSPAGRPADTGTLDAGRAALDDDLAPTGGLAGDPIALDDPGTGTAGVGDELDPRDPRSGTLDDPDNPRRPVV